MKRIIAGIAALMIGVSTSAVSMAAASSRVSVSGDPGAAPVAFLYQSSDEVCTKSIKNLFSSLKNISKNGHIEQTITVTSVSAETTPVRFSLRLEKPKSVVSTTRPVQVTPTPAPNEENILDYYEFVITDSNGAKIYDYKDAEKTNADAEYKDIELETLNKSLTTERKAYTITVTVNSDLANKSSEASRLDWQIVADTGSAASSTPAASVAPSAEPTASVSPVTAAPETVSAEADTESTAAPATDEPTTPLPTMNVTRDTPAPVTSAPATEAPASESAAKWTLARGTYTVGDEISSGRYQVSGDSNVRVYTENGELKTNIILTTDKNAREGVMDYVVTLRNGERLDVSADTVFAEYVPARATATPKAASTAATPRATALTTATTRPGASASPNATTEPKTNPQTGDEAPIALAAVIGAAAAAIFTVLEVYKRKNQ